MTFDLELQEHMDEIEQINSQIQALKDKRWDIIKLSGLCPYCVKKPKHKDLSYCGDYDCQYQYSHSSPMSMW
jgi:hypothetical protein